MNEDVYMCVHKNIVYSSINVRPTNNETDIYHLKYRVK